MAAKKQTPAGQIDTDTLDNSDTPPAVLNPVQPPGEPAQGGSAISEAVDTAFEVPPPSTTSVDAGETTTESTDLSLAPVPLSGLTAPDAGPEAPPVEESPGVEQPAAANPNPATLLIYPLRSYMDEGELRRRAGPGYSAPRRHAELLVQKGLASLEPLEE